MNAGPEHFLQALARRMEGQPPAVRALLEQKFAGALAERAQEPGPTAGERRAAPAASVRASAPAQQQRAATPLAALTEQLQAAASARLADAAQGEPFDPQELASARRFRHAWEAGRTVQQVEAALQRRPANAGPLNSHALVLHSLALMRQLSPDYLRRFLRLAESLQALEQAAAMPGPGRARAAKAAKASRKPRRSRSSDS
ncbi:MAG TPA: DUF2894 domain-containing protein [Ramlibacter sp.]|uniref:DUF2894 domain-containing protein n=1 Tax=Ramlibacter sp. TaxID=1917967 RepID=UPI002D7EBA01|nr:DUF2894 domain-containing protein [Ramlibacter sp.]HET8746675.1 DUF2894 domain-containing protein [Ramlibacter sp.]